MIRSAGFLLLAFAPILAEWVEYVSQISRLGYCLLVPILAGILAFLARDARALRSESPRGRALGAAALAAGGLLLIVGSISSVFTLSIAGFPLGVAGVWGLRHGAAGLQRQHHALLMLCAMVPPPLPLLDRLTPAFVEASGRLTVGLLRLVESGEILWAGSLLTFRGHRMLVSEACSGSGTLLVLGTLGLFLAGLFRLRPLPMLLLMLLVAPLTLFVNALRIALTTWAFDRFGPRAVSGAAHEWLGQILVILAGTGLAWTVAHFASRRAASRGASA